MPDPRLEDAEEILDGFDLIRVFQCNRRGCEHSVAES